MTEPRDISVFHDALSAALTTLGRGGAVRDPVKNVYFDDPNTIDHESLFTFLETNGLSQANLNVVNIENAATLYAIMVVGDQMGVFRVADAVLKYVTMGRVDMDSSPTATHLYNYMKLRDQRTTPEERAMFYKQVFNLGDGEVARGMTVNQNFGPLWETLLTEVIRYIRKYERVDNPDLVSTRGIRQAIINLQHNLSRAASGMVKVYIPEMYAHLEHAIRIIDAPEIKDQLGHGVARDLYNVVENVSMQEFNHYPNTSALRTIADSARKIILAIANYSDASFGPTELQQLTFQCESLMIAAGNREDSASGEENRMRLNGHSNGSMEEEFEEMEQDW